MCVGIPLLGAVLSIAQAAVGFAGAQQQADEQNAYHERNRVAAVAAGRDKYASLNNRVLQEREAASQELMKKRIKALQARATATVSAGESGVTGLSVNALLADFVGQGARQEQAILTNFDIKRQGVEDEMVATHHQTIGRINSVRQASGPSPLSFMLQAAGGALKAFTPTTTRGANDLAIA